MAFSDNFAAGLGHWTISRWRSMQPTEPGDPCHIYPASSNSPGSDLDGATNVLPPADVFIGTGGKLFVGCGAQNYGDTVLRADTKIDCSGTRVITLSALVQASNFLQGWTYLYVTDKPYTAPSMLRDNSHGPVPRYGFCIRLNGVQSYDGAAFQPAPQVFVYNDYVESAEITDTGHAPTISPTAMTAIVITFTHSHLTITANGNTWFDANWTLPAALVDGWVYIGAHNHASTKYDPFLPSHNAVFASVGWDGANYVAQTTYKAPDANFNHTAPSEGFGRDIAYNSPTPTLTIPGVPAGVSSARLLLSCWADAISNPATGIQIRYVLNGNAPVTVSFDYYEASSLMLSAPIDATKLVVGNNTLVVTVLNAGAGYAPFVGNVQLLAEAVIPGSVKLGTTALSVLRIGTTKVLKAIVNGIQIWAAAPDPTVAGAPTLNSATPGSAQVTLAWTAPASDGGSAITGYLVEKSANGTSGWSTVTTTGNVLTYTATGLTNGTVVYFRVSAVNAIGTGAASNVMSATPVVGVFYADNFNRANGGLGSSWVTVDAALAIVSNKAAATLGGSGAAARYNQTLSADQWAEADVVVVPHGGSGNSMGPAVRMGVGTTGAYFADYDASGETIDVYRRDAAGNYAQVVTPVSVAGQSSFKVRIEAQGTTIRLFVNGTQVGSGTDSSVSSGQAGLWAANYGATPTADNFRCGPLPYTP